MGRGRRRDGEATDVSVYVEGTRKFFLSLFIKRGSIWDPPLAMSSILTETVSVEGLKVDF